MEHWMDAYLRSLARYAGTYQTLARDSMKRACDPQFRRAYILAMLRDKSTPPYFWLGADAERV
jgi:hypothetical protein